MRQSVSSVLFITLAFLNICHGDTSLDEFIYPGPSGPGSNFRANLALPLGTTQTIQWTINSSKMYTIGLYQQDIAEVSGLPVATICCRLRTTTLSTNLGLTLCRWSKHSKHDNVMCLGRSAIHYQPDILASLLFLAQCWLWSWTVHFALFQHNRSISN